MLNILLLLVIGLPILALVVGQAGLLAGKPPADLGLNQGKLKRPSKTRNSVSSQADLWPDHPQAEYARIAPLALVGDGPATLARLKAIVLATSGAKLVKEEPGYLYATFNTTLMKYTDDVEFWLDSAAGVVHVRSSSRLGREDFGANRARVEKIRQQLASGRGH
jgi:uncharacterized protein (DUF1499 family)